MATQPEQSSSAGFFPKETVLIIGLGCLIIGFLAGIVFSIYKTPVGGGAANVAGPKQQQAQGTLTPQQSQQLLQLELEVQKNPENVDAWTSLGHLYFDSAQPDKAINAYNKSLALAPNNADVITDLGVMYRQKGDPQQAIASFDKAVAVNPKHETARFNKGIVLLYDLKDQPGAMAAWQELITLNPMATAPNGQLVSEIIKEIQSKK